MIAWSLPNSGDCSQAIDLILPPLPRWSFSANFHSRTVASNFERISDTNKKLFISYTATCFAHVRSEQEPASVWKNSSWVNRKTWDIEENLTSVLTCNHPVVDCHEPESYHLCNRLTFHLLYRCNKKIIARVYFLLDRISLNEIFKSITERGRGI